ncbi:MAG: nitroreductase [Bacteroidota bacterium]
MNLTSQQLNELIRKRRAIFPKTYTDQTIPEAIIQQILENANWAPTHRLTEPWRFRVFRGSALSRLGHFMAELYKTHTPEAQFSEMKYEKTRKKMERSACVIAICMQRDPEERVPEWEELAAVACAVQNMWLSCTALDIGCYWSTPKLMDHAGDFLQLAPGERSLGLFYMGYHRLPEIPGKRSPIAEKVKWIDD